MTPQQVAISAGRALTSGGSQNFLGAPWIAPMLRTVPAGARRRAALRVLALSPHYFYDRDLVAEDARMRTQRDGLIEQLVGPYLTSDTTCIDWGCGPGYLAVAAAARAASVEAVDVSEGVLECARILNPASNLVYETAAAASARTDVVDVIYSIAVIQHLSEDVLQTVLAAMRRRLRPGGMLLLHFARPEDGWRTESEWRSDNSIRGRAKLSIGLHCFGLEAPDLERMVAQAGFSDIETSPLTGRTDADPAITAQCWLTARG